MDGDTLIAALLHDVVEDCGVSLDELSKRFSPEVSKLVDGVTEELTRVWPQLRRLDRLAGSTDDQIINFSISKARDHAWKLAGRLAPLSLEAQVPEIETTDHWVAKLGHVIWRPGPVARFTTAIVRLGERGSVPEIIDLLL